LIDTIAIKVLEANNEKIRIQEEMRLKKEQIENEYFLYKDLIQTKEDLDKMYFELFNQRIKQQQTSIQNTITQLQRLNSL
jgi:hypothetical protein